jgi:hypothetical protein
MARILQFFDKICMVAREAYKLLCSLELGESKPIVNNATLLVACYLLPPTASELLEEED